MEFYCAKDTPYTSDHGAVIYLAYIALVAFTVHSAYVVYKANTVHLCIAVFAALVSPSLFLLFHPTIALNQLQAKQAHLC